MEHPNKHGTKETLISLNQEKLTLQAIRNYRKALATSTPRHVVIDNLFNNENLHEVLHVLEHQDNWRTQKHAYSALYVDDDIWQTSAENERFVKRDIWQRELACEQAPEKFLRFLRSTAFMSVLSRMFSVDITDINVQDPAINTNYFRLGHADFVKQHADDSPSREICMLLYLNQHWQTGCGGELIFMGANNTSVKIEPVFNRCVLFDPASLGAEHWVNAMTKHTAQAFRYNVTSWYWSE